ncbi:MAG: sulfotransferase family protein [Hyphomicrobiales bacterium]|nr:sulfotransferase family protein [Hyphomicrobiales bacterium]
MGQRLPVYFFVHVPKCAGTTFINHFVEYMPDRFQRPPRRNYIPRLLNGGVSDASVFEPEFDKLDIVGGHSMSKSARQVAGLRPVREVILIRDPLSFIVSFYNYRNRKAAKMNLGPISLELFYRSLPRNPISRFVLNRYLEIGYPHLLGYSSSDRLQLIDSAFRRFWFVGSHKHCGEVVAEISSQLGIPTEMRAQNVSPENSLKPEDVNHRLRDQILEENILDRALFEMWGDAKFSGRPHQTELTVSASDHAAHISREVSRNFTYPIMRMKRRMGASARAQAV